MSQYTHVARSVYGQPWAIVPTKLDEIALALAARIRGERLSTQEIAAITAAAPRGGSARASGSTAVIPILGVLAQRVSPLEETSGATSTERIQTAIRQALADPNVGSIVLDVDSPGGMVYGSAELAELIYSSRGKKPIVAIANSLAASAAYWIASAAGELVVTQGGEVGSIGVYGVHMDHSAQLQMEGVKPTMVSAGRFKTEANPYEPLGDEAREALQQAVGRYYDMFTAAVAKHRGVTVSAVRNGFGEGRVVGARESVRLGMTDRIGTLQESIERVQRSGAPGRPPRADGSHDDSESTAVPDDVRRRRLRLYEAAVAASSSGPDLDVRRRRLRLHEAALNR